MNGPVQGLPTAMSIDADALEPLFRLRPRPVRARLFGGDIGIEALHITARGRWLLFITCLRCGEALGGALDKPALVVLDTTLEDAIDARAQVAASLADRIRFHLNSPSRTCQCGWQLR
jgi:hypothetical protein